MKSSEEVAGSGGVIGRGDGVTGVGSVGVAGGREADGAGVAGWVKAREGAEKVAGMGRKVWAGEGAGVVSGSSCRGDVGRSGGSSMGVCRAVEGWPEGRVRLAARAALTAEATASRTPWPS